MLFTDVARGVSFVSVIDEVTPFKLSLGLTFTELTGSASWSSVEPPWTLVVDGAVPLVERTLKLRPERGVIAAVDAVGEIEVADEVVDAAWVIRGDDAALLVHMMPELRTLAELAPLITVAHGSAQIAFEKLDVSNAKRALEGALAVWHRVAFFRLS